MSWSFRVEGTTHTEVSNKLVANVSEQFGMPAFVAAAIIGVARGVELRDDEKLVVDTHGHHGPRDANGTYKISTEAQAKQE